MNLKIGTSQNNPVIFFFSCSWSLMTLAKSERGPRDMLWRSNGTLKRTTSSFIFIISFSFILGCDDAYSHEVLPVRRYDDDLLCCNLSQTLLSPGGLMGKIFLCGTLWNSAQNILPIYWKMCILYRSLNLEPLDTIRVSLALTIQFLDISINRYTPTMWAIRF